MMELKRYHTSLGLKLGVYHIDPYWYSATRAVQAIRAARISSAAGIPITQPVALLPPSSRTRGTSQVVSRRLLRTSR